VTARYRVIIKKSVAKDLKGIPKKDVRRILSSIDSLADDHRPPGTKKLSGQERYRLRQATVFIAEYCKRGKWQKKVGGVGEGKGWKGGDN